MSQVFGSALGIKRALMLDDFHAAMRMALADIRDAASTGAERANRLAALEKAPAPRPAVKPCNPRIAGQDIRRFIPRRV